MGTRLRTVAEYYEGRPYISGGLNVFVFTLHLQAGLGRVDF